ncbi:MAG TPA: CinA family nicotinamide mononucleotide deamidase-related protein [Aggregatilineales bacterium]|nr:CinA family nicotinamide mononucleotide deamidase-related protein [Aggregatilineales bacterium]
MNAEIVSIGTELLLGEITDTNATWIARQLRDNGINMYYITAIGDNQERITKALRLGLERSDLIITTGGLGPTRDDVTRESVAAATDRELVFHQELLDIIAERFSKFGVQMTENNRQQAYVPADAVIFENPVGTAPCYMVESEKGMIISLPGVPREMKYMMEHRVLPFLREKMGMPAIIKARILHTAGIGESMLDDKIGEFMDQANPTVGLAAHSGQTDIRITARADTEADANALIAITEASIRERVEHFIYGVDGAKMDEALTRFLSDNNIQLVICEAGTSGQLSERLRAVSGAEDAVKAMVQYPDVDALQATMDIPGDSLRDIALECIEKLTAEQGASVGMSVLHRDGYAGLAIKTPGKVHNRELNLGTGTEAVNWAFQWGMGYIWSYLRMEETSS